MIMLDRFTDLSTEDQDKVIVCLCQEMLCGDFHYMLGNVPGKTKIYRNLKAYSGKSLYDHPELLVDAQRLRTHLTFNFIVLYFVRHYSVSRLHVVLKYIGENVVHKSLHVTFTVNSWGDEDDGRHDMVSDRDQIFVDVREES